LDVKIMRTVCRKFNVPHNYVHGLDSVYNLAEYTSGNVIIVTDRKVMDSLGHLPKVAGILNSSNIEIIGIIDIESEPSFENLRDAIIQCDSYAPNTIIALGGGAVIDTAKALWYLSIDKEYTVDHFLTKGPRELNSTSENFYGCRLVVIPTTSGTGSEVTCAAVFKDPETGIKKLFLSPLFIPNTAILDPVLTRSLPPAITAQSGFDALTHAIESCLCMIATPFSKAMSLQAISLIAENIEKAVSDGSDIASREAMLYGSSMAGLAISNSCTGLAHSLDQIGSIFGLPHGVAISPLLLPSMELIIGSSPGALTEIASVMKIAGSSDKERAANLIGEIADLITGIGLPLSFSELKIDEIEYMNALQDVIPGALNAFATKVFPVPINSESIQSVLEKAYDGWKA